MIPAPATIELKNVSFSYPGADTPVLNGVNLCIRPGEKIALVGVNGAGKSTLTKLLLRLYEPSRGWIELDGVPLTRYHLERLHKYIGAVRQDFQLYAATMAQNIAMDDPHASHYEGLQLALEQVGMGGYLAALPHRLEHEVTREFDGHGALFSGGEAQKIALSRLFASMPQICLLDEPSAALDPIAEAELNRAMLSAAHEKTVILISHRLSTTRFCDRIVLLQNGRIAEQGSHEQLIALGGEYARMFAAQAGRYRKQ